MRFIVNLFIAGIVMSGCAPLLLDEHDSYSSELLDEYLDILSYGNDYLQRAQSLSAEVKNLIDEGDSLISFFEENSQKDNVFLSEESLIIEVDTFLVVSDDVIKKMVHFQLEYNNYDKLAWSFMEKIKFSTNHFKITKDISTRLVDIEDTIFESNHEILISTQVALIESFTTLEVQIQYQDLNNRMAKWENHNNERRNHK